MPSYKVHDRHQCRLCGSPEVRCFLDFGRQPLTDGFVSREQAGSEFLWPLRLFWCPACHTAQTQHDVEVAEYYRDYRYTVSSSPFAQQFMRLLAESTCRRFGVSAGDSVIEIGSGDGYQLKCFQDLGARVLGFEPSADLTAASRAMGVPVAQCLFTHETIKEIPPDSRPAKVILLTYTFDHLCEPLPFLDAVKAAIDPRRGVLVIEVHDLGKIIDRRETCLFAHEHTIYLTALTMKRLLARARWRLVALDLVPEAQRRGNSLLVAAAPEGSQWPELGLAEQDFAAYESWETFEAFSSAVRRAYAGLSQYVRSRRAQGRRFAGYGAGGRGVMTVSMAGLTSDDLSYVCDQNASFHGLLMPGSHVPVVAPGKLLDEPVDEVIVFSFGYFREIERQLSEYCRRGGKLISLLDVLAM